MKKIEHYGVKGMRWGVRRRGKGGSRRTASEEHTSSRKLLRGKKLSELSNDDLKKLNRRLQMERQFKSISPTAKAEGQRWVGKGLDTFGSAVVGGVAGAAATATVAKLIKGG